MMKRFKVFKKLCSLALILSMLVSMIPMNVFAAPTIDGEETTGTLTINKYDSKDKTTPIEGVEFTAYQVVDITVEEGKVKFTENEKFDDFFSENSLDVNEVAKYDGAQLTALATKLKAYVIDEDGNKLVDGVSKETDANGQAKFEPLDLGYYFVVETNSPERVTDRVAPFLISVPMTNEAGTEWIYDVKAYPKNDTSSVYVTVTKKGEYGFKGEDGSKQTEFLEGVTFDLFKLEQDGKTWTKIKDLELKTDEAGMFKVENLPVGTYRFMETSVGNNDGYILNKDEYYQFTVDWDGITYDTTQSLTNVNIDVTNEKPAIDKTLADGSLSTSASIGSEVRWTITATVPSTVDQLTTYKITDTLSKGLTYDSEEADITVTLDGESFNDYTVDPQGQTLIFTFDHTKLDKGKQLVISYDTTINKKAEIGEPGNPNEVVLEYSTSTGEEIGTTPTEPEIDPKVYTFGLKLTKENKEGEKLSGAVFTLYKEDKDAEDGKTVVAPDLKTDDNGLIQVEGLAAGKYVLVETKAPEEYNLLKEPVEFEITAEYGVKVNENEEKEVYITKTNTKEGYYEMTVLNNKGFKLPETGGMGTVIFTVAGLGMMGLAGSAYIALKRKESQQ